MTAAGLMSADLTFLFLIDFETTEFFSAIVTAAYAPLLIAMTSAKIEMMIEGLGRSRLAVLVPSGMDHFSDFRGEWAKRNVRRFAAQEAQRNRARIHPD